MKEGSLPCCVKDGSRFLGFGDQEPESNDPMRHLLRASVVSARERRCENCQVRVEEMNASEPPMRCRKGSRHRRGMNSRGFDAEQENCRPDV